MFFGVCLFGLFHSLVFLPVLLSLIGPDPYITAGNRGLNLDRSELLKKQKPLEIILANSPSSPS